MAYPKLKIFGYSEAAMYLGGTPKPNVTGLISIHGSREFGVETTGILRLDLVFNDVEVAAPDDMVAMLQAISRRRWAEQNGLAEVAPVPADAKAIMRFAEAMSEAGGIVLCQCQGGMSRAPAAALICLSVWHGAGSEAACVAEVVEARRGAVAHAGLIQFADELLAREGKLVAALAATQR